MPLPTQAIVILDDEKSYLDLIALLLKEQFVNPIVTFSRPLEALDALPSIDVGIVVTDYYMPQLNGVEFILRARETKPKVPYIMISGHADLLALEDYSHVPELRAILAKPMGWHQIHDAISTHWPGVTELSRVSILDIARNT